MAKVSCIFGSIAASAIALILASSVAHAQTNGVSILAAGTTGTSSVTRGWAFSTNTAITINSLGYYDFNDDGLNVSHQVGIWDSLGNLLVSGTVASGTTPEFNGGFRFTSALTGITNLSAGSYIVGGLSNTSDTNLRSLSPSSVAFGPEITYVGDRTNGTAGVFSAPLGTSGFDIGYFGGNFRYTPTAAVVPEAGTSVLLGMTLPIVGAVFAVRRRKNR